MSIYRVHTVTDNESGFPFCLLVVTDKHGTRLDHLWYKPNHERLGDRATWEPLGSSAPWFAQWDGEVRAGAFDNGGQEVPQNYTPQTGVHQQRRAMNETPKKAGQIATLSAEIDNLEAECKRNRDEAEAQKKQAERCTAEAKRLSKLCKKQEQTVKAKRARLKGLL